ncbi:MAG: hypothetical protein SNH55_02445 [Rikenellaceae bacterium]
MRSKLYIAVAALFAVSCSPIVTDSELVNSFDKDNIQLSAYQATAGSNEITLKLESTGITGYWDYIINTKYTDEVTVVFPYTGTHTFTFYSTTPYINNGDLSDLEYVSESIEVEVTQLDAALDDAYYNLVGNDLGGKTWVFNGTAGDGNVWWAMVDGGNYASVWWNATNDYVTPTDVDGKMYFDVAGGANYDYYSSADAEPVRGSFVFNSTFTTLTFPSEVNILGSSNDLSCGATTYEIIELTEDSLILFASAVDNGTGWIWAFCPE